jgi:hypothetical protein
MHKYNKISILVPIISVLLIVAAIFFIKPDITGLVVLEQDTNNKLVNADVTLKTKSSEVIPANAFIQIELDGKKAQMSVSDFIMKTGKPYKMGTGELPEFDFYGVGFTGDHSYSLTLADFNIDRNIGKGEHIFVTRIIYQNQILYEKQNSIMISE